MPSQTVFRFSFEGVSSREIALFTSYVRVLNFKLRQRWICTTDKADLIICSEEKWPIQNSTAAQSLVISASEKGKEFLSLPLDSKEIEIALNRVGDVLEEKGAVRNNSISENRSYRLLRWPPASALTRTNYIRLSTLIIKNSLSAHDMQKFSGLDLYECETFLKDVLKIGILETSEVNMKELPHLETTKANFQNESTKSRIVILIRSSLSKFLRNNASQ